MVLLGVTYFVRMWLIGLVIRDYWVEWIYLKTGNRQKVKETKDFKLKDLGVLWEIGSSFSKYGLWGNIYLINATINYFIFSIRVVGVVGFKPLTPYNLDSELSPLDFFLLKLKQ